METFDYLQAESAYTSGTQPAHQKPEQELTGTNISLPLKESKFRSSLSIHPVSYTKKSGLATVYVDKRSVPKYVFIPFSI